MTKPLATPSTAPAAEIDIRGFPSSISDDAIDFGAMRFPYPGARASIPAGVFIDLRAQVTAAGHMQIVRLLMFQDGTRYGVAEPQQVETPSSKPESPRAVFAASPAPAMESATTNQKSAAEPATHSAGHAAKDDPARPDVAVEKSPPGSTTPGNPASPFNRALAAQAANRANQGGASPQTPAASTRQATAQAASPAAASPFSRVGQRPVSRPAAAAAASSPRPGFNPATAHDPLDQDVPF